MEIFIERENFRPTASYLELGFFQLGGASKYIVPHFVLGTAPEHLVIPPSVLVQYEGGCESGKREAQTAGRLAVTSAPGTSVSCLCSGDNTSDSCREEHMRM